MTDDEKQNFPRTIGGREIWFKPPTDAQVLMMSRMQRIGRQISSHENIDPGDEQARKQLFDGVDRLSKILDIVDSMVISPTDRDFLEDGIVKGTIGLPDLVSAIRGPEQEEGNRAQKRAAVRKAPAKKTAAKKAAKKAPAKKTAKKSQASDSGDSE